MKEVCFITVLPLNRTEYAYSLIRSFQKYNFDKQADLYFIFNDDIEGDFLDWDKKICLSKLILNSSIINTGFLSSDQLTDCEKIFLVLDYLKVDYQFIITIEPESIFIKEIDILQLCYKFYADKILLGNNTLNNPDINKIKTASKNFFDQYLAQLGDFNDSLYMWMNNMCIYDSLSLSDFFQRIQIKKSKAKFCYWCFDFYVYMYYLILFRGFVVVDLMHDGYVGFCEETICINNKKFFLNFFVKSKIYCCTETNINYFNNDNLFMLIHLDRTKKI